MSLTLYAYISRDTAVRNRRTQHGDLTVTVDDAWMQQRSARELELLLVFGKENPQSYCNFKRIGEHFESPGSKYRSDPVELLDATPEGVADWLARMVQAIDRKQVEVEAEEAAQAEEKANRWAAETKEWLKIETAELIRTRADDYSESFQIEPRPPFIYSSKISIEKMTIALIDERFADLKQQVAQRLDELNAAGEVALAEAVSRHEAEQAKKKAEREAFEAERLDWIRDHGSQHLRDLVEFQIPYAETYRNERVAYELGQCYRDYSDICGALHNIRDPSPRAVQALKDERKALPQHDVRLQWLACEDDEHAVDEDGTCECGNRHDDFEVRPVIVVKLLGRTWVREIAD